MNLKKLFKRKDSRKPAYSSEHLSWRERLGEDAYVGWVIIFLVNLSIALALISYAGWLFFLIESNGIASPQAAVTKGQNTGFDQNSLESVISSFSSKEITTSALLRGYDGPSDPSL